MKDIILLFGSTGMLGWYIEKYLSQKFEVVSITRKDYDILIEDSIDKLIKIIELIKPTILINCTNCYKGTYEQHIRINSYFPILLDRHKI